MNEVRMIFVIFLTGYVMKLQCDEIFLWLNDTLDDKSPLKAVVSDTGVPIKAQTFSSTPAVAMFGSRFIHICRSWQMYPGKPYKTTAEGEIAGKSGGPWYTVASPSSSNLAVCLLRVVILETQPSLHRSHRTAVSLVLLLPPYRLFLSSGVEAGSNNI